MKLWPKMFLTLGIGVSPSRKESVDSPSLWMNEVLRNIGFTEIETSNILQDYHPLRWRKRTTKRKNLIMQHSKIKATDNHQRYIATVILPFVLHLSFMVASAFSSMHVQVATWFLSASPPLYWFASHILGYPDIGKKWGYIIWSYCTAYILLGSLLFSNFYPFT